MNPSNWTEYENHIDARVTAPSAPATTVVDPTDPTLQALDADAWSAWQTDVPPQDPLAPPEAGAEAQGLDLATLDGLIGALIRVGGSDLLLSVGTPPTVRVDGQLRSLRSEMLTPEEIEGYVETLITGQRKEVLARDMSVDISFDWLESARIRGNVYRARDQYAMALRHLPAQIPRPEDLGIPPRLISFTQKANGLVLVTGPTGSGKSTTIASLVQRINETRCCHIITVEDPIEYLFEHGQAVVDQRELGWDTPSFDLALRSILREDSDVVLIGEMRDLESIASALTIAETGHLVFATLHTNDAPQTVDRIIDVFPGGQQRQIRTQLAACLLGVVHQRLHPRPNGGRVAAYELLVATDAVRNLIRENKTNQLRNVMTSSSLEGMITLEAYEELLVEHGVITP